MNEEECDSSLLKPVAGNGLLHRRVFLSGAAALLGGAGLSLADQRANAGLQVGDWSRAPGAPMREYGERSAYEADVLRMPRSPGNAPGSGASFSPLERLRGSITPSSLHFERHHNGVPQIDPQDHRLVIHGLVERPLVFDLQTLDRYPLQSHLYFLECSGNSAANNAPEALAMSAGELHGLVSGAEWTGVPLRVLMEEAGVQPQGRWVVAEGADAAAMHRSIPLTKILDDGLLALYQNGERLRPENGYPMRLFLPGWEGNTSVKWLRRLEVTEQPVMGREETAKYTDLMRNGEARMFSFTMDVKSVITAPSGKMKLPGSGYYEVSGIAWSGRGQIARVEVSADGGQSWADAELSGAALPKALTPFRIPWHWDGKPAVLQSRAVDETGAVQPTRETLIAERGPQYLYHYNAIQSWAVNTAGEVSNVYA
ncbi:MAG: sulfite dehydrogenase [Halioglobus sp.]